MRLPFPALKPTKRDTLSRSVIVRLSEEEFDFLKAARISTPVSGRAC
jgi:hypothetical protein